MLKNIHHRILSLTATACMAIGFGTSAAQAQELRTPERWKSAFSNVLPLYRQDTVSICFIGDVMMHASQIEEARRGRSGYDFTSYFSLIEEELASADVAVANMEFSLGGEPYTGYPAFSAPDELAVQAAESGIDVFLAANNHIYDRGQKGAERTLGTYRALAASHGIAYTGLASEEEEMRNIYPLILNIKGIRLALVNFTYATNGGRREGWPKVFYMDSRQEISDAMSRARNADITVVLPHWGEEYRLRHSPQQEALARSLADEGADFIIGTHPHVVQDTAVINGGRTFVAYSLGNAVSNMSAENTQLELMVTVRAVRHLNGDIERLKPELKFLWCSRPGGFNNRYTVVPVEEYIGRRDEWKGAWDYDKMIRTYERVLKETGITDMINIHE